MSRNLYPSSADGRGVSAMRPCTNGDLACEEQGRALRGQCATGFRPFDADDYGIVSWTEP
ncbi:MAG: hypothetical protein PHE86_05350 [Candidatus Marinimicrobia bacterium]|nr:hypothetical protein [Candidatus Neomarinimicrobiota bacterium]